MKALVIGGTGFVGMNVTRALRAGGHQVLATRRQRGNTLFARRLGARLVHAELDDEHGLSELMRGCEVVFMCAGHYPRYSFDLEGQVAIAVRRVKKSLAAAERAGVQRYVLTSSVSAIGPPRNGRRLSDERDPVEPRSLKCVYHAVKAAIEREVLLADRAGPEVVSLCPGAVLGELDVKAGTGSLVVAVGNRALRFYADGLVNVVDADDLARAHVLAAERGKDRERYVLAGTNLTVHELLVRIAARFGVPFCARRLPPGIAGWIASLAELRARALNDGTRPCMSREFVDLARFGRWLDASKAEAELGVPAPSPLDSTLQKACDWYVRHRYVRRSGGVNDDQNSRAPDPERHRSDHSPYPS